MVESQTNRRPHVVRSCREMQQLVLEARAAGRQVGFVPTMGALHQGHLSLVQRSRQQCDLTVVSIFVNPTQFGPQEDLEKYPRTFERDLELLSAEQADYVFAPHSEDIYPAGFSTFVDPPRVAEPLEGRCRPGHFRGVATIVLKLFQLVPAHVAYFGQKDYQQTLVVRHMVADLNVPIRIVVCPTVREPDGLAMSSRNRYLNAQERQRSLSLWEALSAAQELVRRGERDPQQIKARMEQIFRDNDVTQIEYIALADPETLEEQTGSVRLPLVAAVAARVGTTRLIDNVLITENESSTS